MIIQFVKFKTGLSDAEVRRVVEDRVPQFRALPGLFQKYYCRDDKSGEYTDIYLWESEESMLKFKESELARTISIAYKVVGQPRVEILEMFRSLLPEDQVGEQLWNKTPSAR